MTTPDKMEKLNKKEIVDLIVQVTEEYTVGYFTANKTTSLDKQLWASLHIGIIGTLKKLGYDEEELFDCIDKAQIKLQEFRLWKNEH